MKKTTTSILIFLMSLFCTIFYSFSFLFSKYDDEYEQTCGFYKEWSNFYKIFSLIDTFQTIFIPYLIIFIINTLAIFKMMTITQMPLSNTNNDLNNQSENAKNMPRIITRISYKLKKNITKMIFLIGTSYLIINLPILGFKTRQFIHKTHPVIEADNSKKTELTSDSNITIYDYNFDQTSLFRESFNNSNDLNSTRAGGIDSDLHNVVKNILLEEIFSKLAYYVYYINFSMKFFLYMYKVLSLYV
jgi:hypothetical protein